MSVHQFNTFNSLHTPNKPLILLNSWDVASSVVLQQLGAQAIATSSASLAWSNGYADGSKLPLIVHTDSIRKILRVIDIPLTVDIETGYSESPMQVATWVAELSAMGVSGINIEDGDQAPELLAEKIMAIKSLPANHDLFINARTDVYLRQLVGVEAVLNETLKRLEKYQDAGADGGFVPGVSITSDISQLVQQLDLPINVMLSDIDEAIEPFLQLGISRISYGPATFMAAYNHLSQISAKVLNVESSVLNYDSINQAMG